LLSDVKAMAPGVSTAPSLRIRCAGRQVPTSQN
jgi:hypothetical protein